MSSLNPESNARPRSGFTQPDRFEYRQGIWVDRNWRQAGVTEQFLESADTYHGRYFARTDFDEMMSLILTDSATPRTAALRVLDLGSGGGSSVFSIARALPNSLITATDISPQLLSILAELRSRDAKNCDRIEIVCMDIHEQVFEANQFDWIFGAAILHHLLDPHQALRHIVPSLTKGSNLVLIEPLESGSSILMVLFEKVQYELERRGMASNPIHAMCAAMRRDIQARFGPDHMKPWSSVLDDKWVFDQPYLLKLARTLGFESVRVQPVQRDVTRVYSQGFFSTVSDSGLSPSDLPDDMRPLVTEFDEHFSQEFKLKNCPTGAITFSNYLGQ